MDEIVLGILLATVINGLFDAVVVAWIAAKRGPGQFNKAAVEGRLKPATAVIAQEAKAAIMPDVVQRVDERLGRFEAVIRAEMPHPDVQVADLKNEIKAELESMDRGLTAALQQVERAFNQVKGGWGDAENELRKQLAQAGDEGQAAIEEAIAQADTSNPVVRRLYAWAAKPVDPKLEAKNPVGAAILQMGKAAMLDKLQDSTIGGATRSFLKGKGGSWNPGLKG